MGTFGRRPTLKNNTYEEPTLVRDVNEILSSAEEKKWVDNNGNIDIKKIAECENIKIVYVELDSAVSGYLKLENGNWVIGVNQSHNSKRQRFTIAHELGHFYMHREKNLAFEDTTFFRDSVNSSIEFAANEFAANLLMPETKVRDAINSGMKSLEELATRFEVSIAAIKYRVVSLGYKLK